MEQFSHDLTLALEETSKCGARQRWGFRRRTRSTGNLPCAPLPTEDSSSSPADPPNNNNNNNNDHHTSNAAGDVVNTIQSDSDDRHAFAFKMRQTPMSGNFESDSFNENFSPRPNTRRKRKFKRMAVEYETTTPSTPGNSASTPLFPALATGSGTVKKHRVLKHTCQENFRANLFFCGKRKRSHRERYLDYDSQKQHSSSVPRQRDFFAPKGSASYLEYRNRNRGVYSGCSKPCERIMPLTKTIVSKIEKISQDSKNKIQFSFASSPQQQQLYQDTLNQMNAKLEGHNSFEMLKNSFQQRQQHHGGAMQAQRLDNKMLTLGQVAEPRGSGDQLLKHLKMAPKSGSFESALTQESPIVPMTVATNHSSSSSTGGASAKLYSLEKSKHSSHHHHHHHSGGGGGGSVTGAVQSSHNRKAAKHQRRRQLKMQQLQFDDQTFMDCGGLNEFLSSSSLSSSDSEAILTNESDHEGDDELTDWPGNEAMINFASKNDFKRAKPRSKPSLPQIKQQDDYFLDDDTLMSADDVGNLTVETTELGNMPGLRPGMIGEGQAAETLTQQQQQQHHHHQQQQQHHHNHHPQQPPNTLNLGIRHSPASSELDLPSAKKFGNQSSMPMPIPPGSRYQYSKQIESEMSGETSTHCCVASPNNTVEIREIRAGCRRIREERPGFSIISRVNEDLARFLQDDQQSQLRLADINERDKLAELARLYSLNMELDNNCIVISKTSNTMQAIRIDQSSFTRHYLSDYKRRCYGDTDDTECTDMAS